MKSYRIEIKPNKEQLELIKKSCNVSRYAYNWMLGKKIGERSALESLAKMYDLDKVPNIHGSYFDWCNEWTKFKSDKDWIKEVSKCCGHESLKDLYNGYQKFFKKGFRYPKFKNKCGKDSFRLTGRTYVDYSLVQLPIIGEVRLKEKGYATNKRIKLSSVTVSREVDRWFISFYIKDQLVIPKLQDLNIAIESDIVGIDLGIKELAITSDGTSFENPKAYKKYLKKMKFLQRRVSRKKKGSNSRKKAIIKVGRLHRKIKNVRKDATNKMTTSVVKTKPKLIVIEELKVRNMLKNHKLAGSISDASFGEIKRQFEYKSAWNGINIVKAPMFYASSKFCSVCGKKHNELKLSDRTWKCLCCDTEHDRDLNAAMNLKYYGLWLLDKHEFDENQNTVSSTGINASGDERLQFLTEQCSSKKLEFKKQNNLLLL